MTHLSFSFSSNWAASVCQTMAWCWLQFMMKQETLLPILAEVSRKWKEICLPYRRDWDIMSKQDAPSWI